MKEFSQRTRNKAVEDLSHEVFDLLVIGGGITGAAVARDAVRRGLKVALVEREDFSSGTSSKSSKLIHGGLRYLENLEFKLVFEALSERALLLKTVPHLVKPLKFYLPVFEGDLHSRFELGLGMWLYDTLALFRTPEPHQTLSREEMVSEIPFLSPKGLKGGFSYFDASMWDDVLTVETARAASAEGVAMATRVEAVKPIWTAGGRVGGFFARDLLTGREFEIRSKCVVSCVGPWSDELSDRIGPAKHKWLAPSKGVHLLFDLKRIPLKGTLVMSHPSDGRISFVIPRPDYGSGVVIVGTTDGPSDPVPQNSSITREDVMYLMDLLERYFPDLGLKANDILSAYVGVRPLANPALGHTVDAETGSIKLSKVSREHHIETGSGGVVFVVGGKYTTHRTMAQEIVDFTLKEWAEGRVGKEDSRLPSGLCEARTEISVNPKATQRGLEDALQEARSLGVEIPEDLITRYGGEAIEVIKMGPSKLRDPEGFSFLESQLRFNFRNAMILNLADFYFRRVPLYSSRADHGLPWAERLAQVFEEELQVSAPGFVFDEVTRLKAEIENENRWRKTL